MIKNNAGIAVPELLLPNDSINMKKWAVIACDQYTSQPEYWEDVAKFVGAAPSMLHIVLPEIYLKDDHVKQFIEDTKANMQEYLASGVFTKLPPGILLTERQMGGVLRKGILLCVDLEEYDFDLSHDPSVRATEKTLLERIPPRIAIREGAAIESPHVMVLMDDVSDSVIGPLHIQRDTFDLLYDFDLMMNGGRIKGYFTSSDKQIRHVLEAIEQLPMHGNMRFCVGDGNHSLATAKAVWMRAKENLSEEEMQNHPLRYALCEFVNIHDDGIQFMPIHRVIFKTTPSVCLQHLVSELNKSGLSAKLVFGRWRGGQEALTGNQIPFLYRESAGNLMFDQQLDPIALGRIQEILDRYVAENENTGIDYIHGDTAFEELSKEYDNLGLYFAPMAKETFFSQVDACGVLPKKSFSMGEAEQKRYYLECRLLCDVQEEQAEETQITEDAPSSQEE